MGKWNRLSVIILTFWTKCAIMVVIGWEGLYSIFIAWYGGMEKLLICS